MYFHLSDADASDCMEDIPSVVRNSFCTPTNLCWHGGPRRRSGCTFREAFVVKSVWGQHVYFLNYKRMWRAAGTTSSHLTERRCCSPAHITHVLLQRTTHYSLVYESSDRFILNVDTKWFVIYSTCSPKGSTLFTFVAFVINCQGYLIFQ